MKIAFIIVRNGKGFNICTDTKRFELNEKRERFVVAMCRLSPNLKCGYFVSLFCKMHLTPPVNTNVLKCTNSSRLQRMF